MTLRAHAKKRPAIRPWQMNQKCLLFAVALTHKQVGGGRTHHVRYRRKLISAESVNNLTGKTPTLFVFPKAVVYALRKNLRTIAEKTRVVCMTIDWSGRLQQVSLNDYMIT